MEYIKESQIRLGQKINIIYSISNNIMRLIYFKFKFLALLSKLNCYKINKS